MNNWRLLLFAVLCIFQPISSEENLFNGRERCHQQRSDSLRKDTRISTYEYLTTPASEIRRVNTRKEIRGNSEQRETEQDFSRARRQSTSHRGGISQDEREANRRTRSNDRVSLVAHQRYDAETVSRRLERHSLSRSDRIRDERRTDTDNLIKYRRLTSRQETNTLSNRPHEINDNDRRTYEREATRPRITSSRNSELPNVLTSRNIIQREYENVLRRPVQNVRLERNVNEILKQREFVQRDEGESRNLKRDLKANKVNANDRMNLETSRRNTERLVPQNLRDVRQNQRPNVRAQAFRAKPMTTDSHRRAGVDNRRNDILRSRTDFRRHDTERKVQNDFRLDLEARDRRDVDTDRRNNRDEQIRQSFARREQRPSLRTNSRYSRTENRNRELKRDLAIRSQRPLSSERQNKITREFSYRNIPIENADFNRNANERIRSVPVKQTDRSLDDDHRRETNLIRRQLNLEGIRNVKHDNRQRENIETSQRRVNRDDNRMSRSISNRFRQNMERDNDQRHRSRSIEAIRVTRYDNMDIDNEQRLRSIDAIRVARNDEMRENIQRSIPLNDRFANKMVRDESTRFSRTNEISTEYRGVASETHFTFELQYLFYIIQAVYLISIFRKFPQKEGYEKKSWVGSWKTPIVMKMD